MHLMSFLTAHGITSNDVQHFLLDGKKVHFPSAHEVPVFSPKSDIPLSSSSYLG